jgi:hypothetical protein
MRKPWPARCTLASCVGAHLVPGHTEPDVPGRRVLRLTPHEILDRLARLAPPPVEEGELVDKTGRRVDTSDSEVYVPSSQESPC